MLNGLHDVFFLLVFFFFKDTATTEIYTTEDTLSLHDALPISGGSGAATCFAPRRRSTPTRSGTWSAEIGRAQSELQSPSVISYAVFCLKKKKYAHALPDFIVSPRHDYKHTGGLKN